MSYNFSNNYGLNPNYNYYEFSLDSNDAARAFNSSFSKQDWPIYFLGGKRDLTNIAAVKILEVQIPFSYYVFTGTNILTGLQGTGQFTYTDPLGTQTVAIVGNYSSAQLVTKLKTILDAARVANGGAANAFTVTFDATVGTFTISAGFVFTLTFPIGSCFDALGFNQGANTSSVGGVLTSSKVALVSGPNYLYLNSNMMGTLVNLYLPSNEINVGGNAGPQIAKIPVNTAPNGIIYWQDPDPQKWFDVENLQQLQQLDFFLTLGSDPTVVKLNGLSFSVKFGVLLNKENLQEQQKQNDMSVKRVRTV